jgi:CHAT domain-containing protein
MRMKGWMIVGLVLASGGLLLWAMGVPIALAEAQTVEPNALQVSEAERLFQQGIQQYRVSQFELALKSWQQTLMIYREIKDRWGEGKTLGNLGLAYHALGNYPEAIEYQKKRLAIAREFSDRKGEEDALGNLGITYDSLGDYTQAIDYQEKSLAIARELKDRQGEAVSLGNLGIIYDSLGNYAKAIECQEQRLAIARELKDQYGEEKSLGNLGIIYDSLGNYPKAIDYQEQSLAIARVLKDRDGEGAILGNLGLAHQALGNYAEAINFQEESLAIAREVKDPQAEGQSLGNLGLAYQALGDYSRAIDYQEQSLAIACKIGDHRGEGLVLGNLGNVHFLLGNYTRAIDYQKQRLTIARKLKDRLGEGNSLNNLGAVLFKLGDLIKAENTLFNGITVWELLRQEGVGSNDVNKVSIFEAQAITHQTLQKVLIAQTKSALALEVADRGRSRALVDLLKQKLAADSKTDGKDKSGYSSTAQIQQTAKAQNASLVEYSIIYDDFKINGKQETKESALYIWVIAPDSTITFRQVDLKPLWQNQHTQLADLITTSRETLGVRSRKSAVKNIFPSTFNPDEQKRNLQQLHKLLIEPIADLLPKDPNDQVIFIPQGELFLVPFPALQAANGQYLIEQHTLRTAPAIQVLDLTRQQKQKQATQTQTNTNLIIGNPIMPSVTTIVGETPIQLAKLPDAQREAESIANRLHTKAYTTDQARKATILKLLPTARRIHFATHGLLDDFKGLGIPGAIALAPDGTKELNDGLLTASEIFDLKLNADLVVLSACNTGNGKITGDGVIGLSRSFISAGVPSVVVSLWSVPDSPTADLMTQFYQNLETNPNKAQALRQAMLTTMKNHPNPIDWAAFTLIGESD